MEVIGAERYFGKITIASGHMIDDCIYINIHAHRVTARHHAGEFCVGSQAAFNGIADRLVTCPPLVAADRFLWWRYLYSRITFWAEMVFAFTGNCIPLPLKQMDKGGLCSSRKRE